MAYQNGNWLTAAVDEDGKWHGSLDRIEAGYGYWVFANTFDTLAPLIPEIEPTSVPLTVRVVHGWNLVGVVDVFQNAAGTAPGAEGGGNGEADTYFGSIDWRVAYTFDPQYKPLEPHLAGERQGRRRRRQRRSARDRERPGLLGLVRGAGHTRAVAVGRRRRGRREAAGSAVSRRWTAALRRIAFPDSVVKYPGATGARRAEAAV